MEKIHEAAAFFKSEEAYHQLFQQMRKKYESIGRIGGTIPVKLFSTEELAVISTFFGMPAEKLAAKTSISIKDFEKQLQTTKFGEIGLKELLDAYFGEEIISNKQIKLDKEAKLQHFLQVQKESHPVLGFWFDYLAKKNHDSRWILRLAQTDQSFFEHSVDRLAYALAALPLKAERLPMFAQRITADPHAFDMNGNLGKLLLHVLAVHHANSVNDELSIPTSTEEINDLLQKYHVYRDDLLNFVTCAGFIAEKKDGSIHPLWQAAAENRAVLNMPLREITSLGRVYPQHGKHVWLVENSGVCASILDQIPCVSIISTNGQFKLAALLVMDLLVKDGCILHYAGDFDPEGLQMAQRLLDRYPDHVRLWHMDLESYRKSGPSKQLSAERLEKLHGITDGKLRKIADEMVIVKKAGYQEALVSLMVRDLIREAYCISTSSTPQK